MAQAEGLIRSEDDALSRTLSATVAGGEIQKINDRAAIREGLKSLDSGDEASWAIRRRVFEAKKASGVTFSEGDDVYWDASANTAVNPGLALDGSADFYLGRCVKAAASGDTFVLTDLNAESRYERLRPLVFEFDHADTDEHVLIPASQNPHGLAIIQCFAIVTEQPAGSTEDQLVLTVEDEDDNVLSTMTTTDTSPDAVGDCVIGTNGLWGASTGEAKPKVVAAGKAVQGQITQQTAGTPAGKLKAYVLAVPLV